MKMNTNPTLPSPKIPQTVSLPPLTHHPYHPKHHPRHPRAQQNPPPRTSIPKPRSVSPIGTPPTHNPGPEFWVLGCSLCLTALRRHRSGGAGLEIWHQRDSDLCESRWWAFGWKPMGLRLHVGLGIWMCAGLDVANCDCSSDR